jgi:hypothetical protein
MARGILVSVMSAFVCLVACLPAWCGRVYGEVTSVTEFGMSASFPAMIRPGSAMLVMSGDGESVSGMAIAITCKGTGPYEVTGAISWINDQANFTCGKKIYVNSLNASAIPSKRTNTNKRYRKPKEPPKEVPLDLGVYYYSTAQKVGYGALGLGIEKTLPLDTAVSLDVDGGITGLAGEGLDADTTIHTDSLMKSLNGRLKVKMGPGGGVYAGYRWSEGSGSTERWDRVAQDLIGKEFAGNSGNNTGTVEFQGAEYGISLNAAKNAIISVGYIPKFRTDFGGLGVITERAHTAELRFGNPKGGVRIRGIGGEDYWVVDLGVTISK